MKIAIIYESIHHNNTEKLISSIDDVDIYKVSNKNIDLSKYDLVGLASGIYMGNLHKNIDNFIDYNYKNLNNVFIFYTCGSNLKRYGNKYKKKLEDKSLNVKDTIHMLF